jgi:hypothetical protein
MQERQRPHEGRRALAAVTTLSIALVAGCASIGPGTIGRDRVSYDQAISDSWKQQLLLNLVKLRYGDAPVFLEVASVINSYSLDTQLDLGASLQTGLDALNTATVGGSAHYSDRPTITYNPLLGDHFTRSLMTPISPSVIFALMQSGWQADAVFRVMVSSANGVRNRFGGPERVGGGDPDFYRLLDSLRKIQAAGAIGMRVERGKEQERVVLVLNGKRLDERAQNEVEEVRRILGLKRGAHEFRIVYGFGSKGDDEVAIVTRSLLEVLFFTASWIDVPEAHVAEKRVLPTVTYETETEAGVTPLMKVSSGPSEPRDAFVSVRYRDTWFWIDDRDPGSKQALSFLLLLSSLTDAGPSKGAPVVTIPAG